MTFGKIIVWCARIGWVATALAAATAWGDAFADRSTAVGLTAAVGGWATWGVAMIALAALSTVSLTVARLVITMAIPVQLAVAVDTPGVWAVAAVALSVVTATAVMSAEFAQACVQASAYGAEERFPLRPPAPFVAPMALAWMVLTAAWCIGPLALAARSWVLGGVVSTVAVAAAVVLGRRFHRLTRRWLVLVPAGVVLHDHLLLTETVLMRRNDLAGLQVAVGGPDAVDLTGLTWGTAVQIDAREPQVVIPRGVSQGGEPPRPARVRTIVVAPSRPGQLLTAARRVRLA